jgi:hypothetical protein
MSADEIKEELNRRWRGEPILRLCINIVDYISSFPPGRIDMLTFGTLAKAAGKDHVDNELMQALAILTGSRVAALDPRALLVDEDETEHEIAPEELAEARATGQLIHPETGEQVFEYESKVIPFFVPSARFLAGDK